MRMYLKNGALQRMLTIELFEGQTPVVVDLPRESVSSIADSLEPAIWFKVMILETINIDCCNRMVAWADGVKDIDGNPVTNVIYGEDRSCYDFDDDADELFKLADSLIDRNPPCQSSEELVAAEVTEYERCVIRLLHCYILNKIVFAPSDKERIRTALTAQRKAITKLDDTALVHSRTAEHYSVQLRSIREKEVLPILEGLMIQKVVNTEFIQALDKDLNKLEHVLRRDIDHLQKNVDSLKAKAAALETPATEELPTPTQHSVSQIKLDLATARRYRDEAMRRLELHLVAKELCRTWNPVTYDGGGGGGGDAWYDNAVCHDNEVVLNEWCARYLALHKRVMTEKGFANLAITKKLRAVSVRECMESVIKDLERGVDSTGDDVTVDGQRVTDVMTHEHSAPEWQTLTQRLSAIVYNREHPVGIAFNNFCVNLQTNYREIILSLERIDKANDHHGPTYEDFYVVSETDYGLNQNFLENQRNLICSHLYQITELLAEVFGNYWEMFIRKIRLCYEKCLYNRIGRDLISMYRLVHTQPMQDLQMNISKLKTLQISQLQLQMKWEWWLQLFAPQNDIAEGGASQLTDPKTEVTYMDDIDGSPSNDDDVKPWDRGYLSELEPDSIDPVAFLTDIGEDEIADTCSGCCDSGSGSGHVECFRRSLSADTTVTNPDRGGRLMRSYSISSITSNGSCGRRESRVIGPGDCSSSSPLPGYRKVNGIAITHNSMESNTDEPDSCRETQCPPLQPKDTLIVHFGPALQAIRNVFSNPSPLKKMQCLTAALRMISKKVEDLRLREHKDLSKVNREKVMVTAEDLLPLLVLVLLQLLPEEVAKLYVELLFVSDMMAEFLSSGCHSFALCEFQIAFRVIEQTSDELSIS